MVFTMRDGEGTMEPKIRPAVLEDATSIAHVHVASWRAAYPGIVPQSFLNSLDELQFTERWQTWLATKPEVAVYVAEENGLLCGFASGGLLQKPIPSYDGELYALYLLPLSQRRGIGRALFRRTVETLVSRGVENMLLWVLRQNTSTAFYERLGGEQVADDVQEIGGAKLAVVAYGWPNLATRSWQ